MNIDSAVVEAWQTLCSICDQYGASVKCKGDGCAQIYHYPCAIAAGFLDINNMTFYCAQHVPQSEQAGHVGAYVCVQTLSARRARVASWRATVRRCCFVRRVRIVITRPVSNRPSTYRSVYAPAGSVTSVNCAVCAGRDGRACTHTHTHRWPDDGKVVSCEACDKGYHTYCVQPPMSAVPKGGWKCKVCAHTSIHSFPGTELSSMQRLWQSTAGRRRE